ncbi:carbohydrate ABC transporter permease [Paenibacillus alba]|uniref:Carbohydrate ABC transporter permease n=1 Tax=Paenibacillus alba TaxID=1197127 RepID=A0ABU6G3H1_9BACL|nr:carbohydrate ABC transporter permease [Paenibacillus alba]MEC0228709.1 carbohydrate ABC transporter permease [Paenibacillus alba]
MNKRSFGATCAVALNYTLLIIAAVVTLFPFIYVVSVSLTTEAEVLRRGVVIIPEKFTLEAYRIVFSGLGIKQAYIITLFRTIVGTTLNLVFTAIAAYVLSKKALPGRSGFLMIIVFTMLFSGGLIPTYILIKSLGLINSVWSLILPGLISVFNLIVMKTFFEQLPPELEESARVDGAGELTALWKIVIPLSIPSFATIGLFYAVQHWNSYFDAIMYINKPELMPIQVVLRNILLRSQYSSSEVMSDEPVSIIAIQMAAVIVSTVPILCVYPLIQKHFTKGVMVGSVKG